MVSKTSGSTTLQDVDSGAEAKVEPKTTGENALHVISEAKLVGDLEQSQLEKGNAYNLNIEYVMNLGQTVYQSFTTPNTSDRVYLRFKTYSSDRTEIQFWESPTVASYAFSWTPKNRNRETTNVSGATIQAVSTLTTPGSFLFKESNYGSGLTQNQSQINFSERFLLKPNTEYMFAMKSYAASNLTTLQLQWYED